MNSNRRFPIVPRRLAFAAFLVVTSLAQAHPGHGPQDLIGGFLHPLTGWDHLLAMVSIGAWAALMGGRSRWVMPASFLALMAVGAFEGRNLGPIPGLDQAIAASVVVLGLLLVFAVRLPAFDGAVIAGLFALFHGYAHGSEMSGSSLLPYSAGFAAATALLLGAGVLLGTLARRSPALVPRAAGAAVAIAGAWLIFG